MEPIALLSTTLVLTPSHCIHLVVCIKTSFLACEDRQMYMGVVIVRECIGSKGRKAQKSPHFLIKLPVPTGILIN